MKTITKLNTKERAIILKGDFKFISKRALLLARESFTSPVTQVFGIGSGLIIGIATRNPINGLKAYAKNVGVSGAANGLCGAIYGCFELHSMRNRFNGTFKGTNRVVKTYDLNVNDEHITLISRTVD